jgi:hypothetical protein
MSSGSAGLQSTVDARRGKANVTVSSDSSGYVPGMQPLRDDAAGKETMVHGMWQAEAPVDEEEVLEFDIDGEVEQVMSRSLRWHTSIQGRSTMLWAYLRR